MRDETIAIRRACEDISTSFHRLNDDWNRLFMASLISPMANVNLERTKGWGPMPRETREKLRMMAEGIMKNVLLLAQAYAAPLDVCRTMFDSYDRLHKECFIGIIRREAAMGWANICAFHLRVSRESLRCETPRLMLCFRIVGKAQWTRYSEAYDNLEMGKKLEEAIGSM